MLVAGEQDVAVQQSGFCQNQGVVNFLGWKQSLAAKLDRQFPGSLRRKRQLQDRAEASFPAQQLNGTTRRLPHLQRQAGVRKKG